MRAVQVRRFGNPEVLEIGQVPDPVAGPGEVVVAVAFAPLLFVDTQIRRGLATQWFPVRPPYVPGVGVAGQVISVGQGVDELWIGRRVVAGTGHGGGYAEQALAPAAGVVAVPDALGLPEAAALLQDGKTALRLVEVATIQAGQSVLVTAAAGGLGSLLVELGHAAGAQVVAAAGGPRKLELARQRGAEAGVDYSEPDWPERVLKATDGQGVDVVFDGVGGQIGAAAFQAMTPGGRFLAYGAPSGGFATIDPDEADQRGVRVLGIEQVQLGAADARRLTEGALLEGAAGRLTPVIGQIFPLDRAAEAHTTIEARQILGKALLANPH